MRSVTWVWSVAALLGLLFIASAARADPFAKPATPEAREHLTRGNRLYGVRSFEEAIAEYKAGALVEPAPVFDYNLGQCFRQLRRYREALWYYEHVE
jgi:tetratricopeptide (TPR) repeat protein